MRVHSQAERHGSRHGRVDGRFVKRSDWSSQTSSSEQLLPRRRYGQARYLVPAFGGAGRV
jgi:hypothetical protein